LKERDPDWRVRDPQKWEPVLRKDHAQTKNLERNPIQPDRIMLDDGSVVIKFWLPPTASNRASSVNSGVPSPRWLDGNRKWWRVPVTLRPRRSCKDRLHPCALPDLVRMPVIETESSEWHSDARPTSVLSPNNRPICRTLVRLFGDERIVSIPRQSRGLWNGAAQSGRTGSLTPAMAGLLTYGWRLCLFIRIDGRSDGF